MEVAVIYNPNATGLNNAVLESLCTNFLTQNMKVTLYESKYQGNVIELVKEANQKSDIIVSVGGDGTLGECFIAFNECNQKSKYIHIPTGTANDTADNFKLYKGNPMESIKKYSNLDECSIKKIDMVTANQVPFAYVSSCGTFTNLTYETPKSFKKNFGKLGYYFFSGMIGLTAIPDIINKPLTLTYTKGDQLITTKALTMIVSNSKTFAGFNLFKNASITDGLFEVTVLKQVPKTNLLPFLYNLFKDDANDFDITKYPHVIDSFSTDNFKVKFESVPKLGFNHDGDHSFISLNDDQSIEYKVSSKVKMLIPNR